MKLLIFNGSPRGNNSNTNVIISWFIEGLNENIEYKTCNLISLEKHNEYIEKVNEYDTILITFPLYTDSMPGIVKEFFEKMEVHKEKLSNYNIGFIIHSGFSEAIHSRAMEKYFIRLTDLLRARYAGTLIIPGSEGFRIMPEQMLKKKKSIVMNIAKSLIANGKFDDELIRKISKPENISSSRKIIFKLLTRANIGDIYWNRMLKQNKVFEKRFAKPYLEE